VKLVTIKMTPEERARLNAISERLGMTASAFIRDAVARRLEDVAMVADAMQESADGS